MRGKFMNINDIISVAKNEFRGMLRSKTIFLIALLIPFAVTFLSMYSIVFSVESFDDESKNIDYTAYSMNTPQEITDIFKELDIETKEDVDLNNVKRDLKNKKCDLFIMFPEDFSFESKGTEKKNIQIWYNSTVEDSVKIYTTVSEILNNMMDSPYTINKGDEEYDVANQKDLVATMMFKLTPTVLISALFFICQSIAIESIAGDKERGFLPTVLVTPISRTSIAAGKTLGIFSIMLLSGISAFAGLALSIPIVTKKLDMIDGMIFKFSDYLKLFALTMTAVLVIVSVLLLISTLTKNVKEASSAGSIISVSIVLMSVLSNIQSTEKIINNLGTLNIFIPIWNSVKEMSDLLLFDTSGNMIILTCLINIAYSVILLIAVGKCFNREKLVYG